MEHGTISLLLARFCGEEKYPVLNAEWKILDGDGTWDDPSILWLEMEFGHGINLHDDTASLNAKPHWELSFSALSLKKEDLK